MEEIFSGLYLPPSDQTLFSFTPRAKRCISTTHISCSRDQISMKWLSTARKCHIVLCRLSQLYAGFYRDSCSAEKGSMSSANRHIKTQERNYNSSLGWSTTTEMWFLSRLHCVNHFANPQAPKLRLNDMQVTRKRFTLYKSVCSSSPARGSRLREPLSVDADGSKEQNEKNLWRRTKFSCSTPAASPSTK